MTTVLEKARGAAAFSCPEREIPLDQRNAAFFVRQSPRSEWQSRIENLISFRSYEDDWDGDGALAPEVDLVDSAITLAQSLQSQGHAAPDRVVVGGDGTIFFEWHGPAGYYELEVCSPIEAEGRLVPHGSERAIVERFHLGA